MSHVTHTNMSRHKYKWVMSHTRMTHAHAHTRLTTLIFSQRLIRVIIPSIYLHHIFKRVCCEGGKYRWGKKNMWGKKKSSSRLYICIQFQHISQHMRCEGGGCEGGRGDLVNLPSQKLCTSVTYWEACAGEVGGWGRVPLERWGAGVEYH